MDKLEQLAKLAERQVALDDQIKALHEQLEAVKSERDEIAEVQLPDLMEEIGIETFSTKSGLSIDVSEQIRASITKAQQAAAFAWLIENGHGNIIKNEIKAQFGKGEDDKAQELARMLHDMHVTASTKQAVHPQTLNAFVREMLDEGVDLPEDAFTIFRQRAAKIKLPG